MHELVKARIVGGSMVVSIPIRIRAAMRLQPGEILSLHYDARAGQLRFRRDEAEMRETESVETQEDDNE